MYIHIYICICVCVYVNPLQSGNLLRNTNNKNRGWRLGCYNYSSWVF